MSESAKKAVFLSYASQDAEAAKRICEALRAVSVEVWFDAEGGLEHGDEWDAKIRRQIKECVLFIPLISANTQSRHEGYFRLEWELAAERSMTIASGVPFVLPVIVDDTREPEALVPDRFRKVQWTRLPGGVVSPEVQARFLKLWSHRAGVLSHEEARAIETGGSPPQKAGRSGIKTYVLPAAAVVVLVVATVWWFASSRKAVPGTATAPVPAVAPTSEARQLVAKAWEQLNKTCARAELEAAEQLCKRAADLDPTDANVWATWSQVDTWFVYHNYDRSLARRERAREKAARAMQLAPRSYEARLAEACYWVRVTGATSPVQSPAEAERLLRELLREKPDEPRAQHALGMLMMKTGKPEEGFRAFAQMAKNPGFAAIAWMEIGFNHLFRAEFREAEEAADRSVAILPYWNNLGLKVYLALTWEDDVDAAKAAIDRMPAASMQEDWAIGLAYWVYDCRREPQAMLSVLETLPREWLHTNGDDEPKAMLTGEARQKANQPEAAKADFRRALDAVEKQLGEQPNSTHLLFLKIQILSDLGDWEEAGKTYKLRCEISGGPDYMTERYFKAPDEVISAIEKEIGNGPNLSLTASYLRLGPIYDRLRGNPRFQALLARLDADPRFSPRAKPAGAGASSINQATDSRMPATAPLTEAQRLVAKAWELLNKTDHARAELVTAEGLCKRAAEIDPNDADVWAAWSQVNSWYVWLELDKTEPRREAAREYAARAMQLAPNSFESRLAQACCVARCYFNKKMPVERAEAERQLRKLLAEKLDEPRTLLALMHLLFESQRTDDVLALLDCLAKNPAFAATAWCERGDYLETRVGRYADAETAFDRSIALMPFWGNLGLKAEISLRWDGDLEAARAVLMQIPASSMAEDFGAGVAWYVYWYRREPDKMLQVLDAVPHDWMASNWITGPKQQYIAIAYEMEGKAEAAKLEWRRALELEEKKLEDHPEDDGLQFWKSFFLLKLGERDEAKKAIQLWRELGGDNGESFNDCVIYMRAGELDSAVRLLEKLADANDPRIITAANLRLSPFFDPIRNDPRFEALLARLEADPRFSPHAKPAAAGESTVGQASDSKPAQETKK